MTQGSLSVEGKYTIIKVLILLTSILPSLIVKDSQSAFYTLQPNRYFKKDRNSLHHVTSLSKSQLYLRHLVLKKKRKKITHALPLTASQENRTVFAKLFSLPGAQSLQSGRRKNGMEPLFTLLLTYLFLDYLRDPSVT